MTDYTPDVKSNSATLRDNTLGRKLQDPNRADAPIFIKRFYYKNTTAAAITDSYVIDLGPVLGPGFILPQSFISSTALGAARLLNLGFNTYKSVLDNSSQAGSITALLSGLDVSSAYNKFFGDITAATNPDGFELLGPANLLLQVTGGTIPVNGIISGQLVVSKPL